MPDNQNNSDAAEVNPWQAAVDQERVTAHLGIAADGVTREEASKQLAELINWHVAVATDPRVNGGYVLSQQPASAGEEIMVNAAHDVFILPLQPSGLLSGPRFVVHVPAPEQQPAPHPASTGYAQEKVEVIRAAVLSADLYQVLMDVQNGIDSPGLASMANNAIRKIDAARAALRAEAGMGDGNG